MFGFDLETFVPSNAVVPMAVDVRREDDVQRAIESVVERRGALHAVVNCAGIIRAAKTISKGMVFPLAIWDDVLAVNLTGTFNVCRFAAQAMAANSLADGDSERGVIVNVASGAAKGGKSARSPTARARRASWA